MQKKDLGNPFPQKKFMLSSVAECLLPVRALGNENDASALLKLGEESRGESLRKWRSAGLGIARALPQLVTYLLTDLYEPTA